MPAADEAKYRISACVSLPADSSSSPPKKDESARSWSGGGGWSGGVGEKEFRRRSRVSELEIRAPFFDEEKKSGSDRISGLGYRTEYRVYVDMPLLLSRKGAVVRRAGHLLFNGTT